MDTLGSKSKKKNKYLRYQSNHHQNNISLISFIHFYTYICIAIVVRALVTVKGSLLSMTILLHDGCSNAVSLRSRTHRTPSFEAYVVLCGPLNLSAVFQRCKYCFSKVFLTKTHRTYRHLHKRANLKDNASYSVLLV